MDSGVGVTPDSVLYIGAARSLVEGKGLKTVAPHSFPQISGDQPLTVVPPTYPVLLALSATLSSDPLQGARWLQALLFALNVLLIGMTVYLCTNKAVLPTLCAILLFLSTASVIALHAMAWSEPAFFLFGLSAFLLLALHIRNSNDRLLVGSSLLASLALTTRYMGITLFPPMILTILLLEDKPLRKRVRDCLILLGVGLLPLAVWLLHNLVVAESATSRVITFHPIGALQINGLVDTLLLFWVPIPGHPSLKTALLFLSFGLVFAKMLMALKEKRRCRQAANISLAVQLLTSAFTITYLLFLFVAISFIDAQTAFESRILSPVYVFGIILVVSVACQTSSLKPRTTILWRGAFLVLSFVLIYLKATEANAFIIARHTNGSGYTERVWRDSESIKYVKALPETKIIYSNGVDAIQFLTGREALRIPAKIDPGSRRPNANFDREIEAMENDIMANRAVVIYLDRIDWRWYLPSKEELEQVYKLPLLTRFFDGVIYGIK